MLKLLSSLFSNLKKKKQLYFIYTYLKKIEKIQVSSFYSYLKKIKMIFVSSFSSDFRKIKMIQVMNLFSSTKRKKKNLILLGVFLLFLIFILLSKKEKSDSNANNAEKILEQIQEKNKNEIEIKKIKKEKIAEEHSLKILKSSPSKKTEKKPPQNKLQQLQQNDVKQTVDKLNQKKEIKISETPLQIVKNLHIGLKKVSNKKDLYKYNDLISLIKNTYNAEKMIAKIIGDTWKKTTREDQEEIVNIFQEYIAKNYIKRFKKIKDPAFNYKKPKKIGEKLMLVKTDLVFDKNDVISINYLLLFDNNKWRIFDVLLAGSISEIATKKSEFSGFISDKTIAPLIDALKKKNSMLDN